MVSPLRIGIIGCGDISNAYAAGVEHYAGLELAACADLDVERARTKAAGWHLRKAYRVDELLADEEIDLVLNLTIPAAHAEIDVRALEAGMHVYSEKPLALSCAEAASIISLARDRNLRLGCAPDTFLGAGLQCCRKLIDEGAIGTPVTATAFMACAGHEDWHPSPEFLYQIGGGPLLDMGPYYLTALVHLLGPIARVTGFSNRGFDERTVASRPREGARILVEVDTTICAALEFVSGATASLLMSFDVVKHALPHLQVHGTEGSLWGPDPNAFGGEVRLARGDGDWETIPHTHPVGMRGAGASDLAHALATGREHRASGDLAYHVLEVMEGLLTSDGTAVPIRHRAKRPAAVPARP